MHSDRSNNLSLKYHQVAKKYGFNNLNLGQRLDSFPLVLIFLRMQMAFLYKELV